MKREGIVPILDDCHELNNREHVLNMCHVPETEIVIMATHFFFECLCVRL